MRQRKTIQLKIQAGCLFMLILLLSGCAPASPSANTAPALPLNSAQVENPDPFITSMKGEEGIFVELRGDTRGHLPGKSSTFLLDVHNETGTTWQARYCVQLLDREGVVETLAENQFSLQTAEGFGTLLNLEFPERLEEDAYGLSLAIPGRLEAVTTIYVGEKVAASGGPWPPTDCP